MRAFPRLVVSVVTATSIAVLGAAGAPAPASAAPDPGLRAKVSSVMRDSRVLKARSGSIVLDARTGEELYRRYAWRATTPASNTKIVTAVAAMSTLGAGYRFKTEVIRRGPVVGGTLRGRLYLKGYGDPTARVADYASLARQVRAAGVRRVTESLAIDASYFDQVRYNPRWSTSYASAYYAAQVSGLTLAPNADLDSGTVYLTYAPGKRGKKARVGVYPAAAARYVRIVNKTTTGKRGSSASLSARRAIGTNTITVRGRVPAGRRAAKRLVTVHRPELIAAAVFRRELARVGVRVAGTDTSAVTPRSGRTVVAVDRSITVAQLLVPFMKLSNNMHAEALTKAMGAKGGGQGTWSSGLAATRAVMRRLGAPMDGVRLYDGSGLARRNKLTARALARVLYGVQREPWFASFYRSLPVAGNVKRMTGGTLRYRMNRTRAANNAVAKTGTLTGVTALSGYVTGRNGRRYVFSMVSQHNGRTPRPVENAFVVALANWNG